MNDTKKLGRPKQFDRDDALARAVSVFWKHGYEGASVKRLTDAMGISSPSLYAEFGDKHALYVDAIRSYTQDDACAPIARFEAEPDIVRAVLGFFEAVVTDATDVSGAPRGCFLASCVSTSAGHVEGVATLLRQAIETTETRIAARFDEEKAQGTLPPDFPSRDRARLQFDLRQGLVFRARAGCAPEDLRAGLDGHVRAVLAPAHS